MANDFFWLLKKDLDDELHSFNLGLSHLTQEDLTEKVYLRFMHQSNRIQDLFDQISVANKELALNQSNPDFYNLLQAKQDISDSYGQFNRLRNIFYKQFAKFRNIREEDIGHEHTVIENGPEDEEQGEELPEEELDFDEDEFDPEAELEEKAAAKKARQKKLALAGKKQDALNAEQRRAEEQQRRLDERRTEDQRQRQEEANRQNINIQDNQAAWEEAQHQERLRQEQALAYEAVRNAERVRQENEALRNTNERLERSSQFEHLENSHIDMSGQQRQETSYDREYEPPGTDSSSFIPTSEPPRQEPREEPRYDKHASDADYHSDRLRRENELQQNTERTTERVRQENEALRRTNERLEHAGQFERLQSSHIDLSRDNPASQYNYDAPPSQESYRNSEPVITPVYDNLDAHEPSASGKEEPYSQPQQGQYGSSLQDRSSHSSDYHGYQDTTQQHLREEAIKLGMDVRPGQVVTQADLHQARIVHESDQVMRAEKTAEQLQNQEDALRRTQEKVKQSDQFEHLDSRHIDMSREGIGRNLESPSQENNFAEYPHVPSGTVPPESRTSPQPYIRTPFVFTPDGTVPAISHENPSWSRSADSNAKIYSSLMTNRSDNDSEPVSVSRAYMDQMRFNLERTHIAYQSARGTQAAQKYAHEYQKQREPIVQLENAIKQGRVKITEPAAPVTQPTQVGDKPSVLSGKSGAAAVGAGVVHSFSPSGTVSQTIERGHLTGNRYDFSNPGLKNKPAYSPSNPMMVSKAYEDAIYSKMRSVRASLDSSIAKGDAKTPEIDPVQAKMYMDAWLGFQRAKQAGTVVVSDSGSSMNTPNYSEWQQRQAAFRAVSQNAAVPGSPKTPFGAASAGTTGYFKGPNPNQTSKQTVDTASANLFNSKSRLNQRSLAALYAQQVGSGLERYSTTAFLKLSSGIYRTMQTGDDNALRTFETGRYYVTTAAGIVIALNSQSTMKGLENHVVRSSAREFTQYGTKSLMTNAEISSSVNNGLRMNRELSAQIAEVKGQLKAFGEPTELDKLSRLKYNKLNAQLQNLQMQQDSIRSSTSQFQRMQTMRHEAKLEQTLLDKLDAKNKKGSLDYKNLKNPKQLRAAANEINRQMSEDIQKKFAGMKFHDKGIQDFQKSGATLSRVTSKSLDKDLKRLMDKGKGLKVQVTGLEAKGSALTQAERKLLIKLKKELKANGADIAKLKGLKRAFADQKFINQKLDNMVRTAFNNKQRITNGLYALQGFMLRPLQAGAESNTDGLAVMIRVASNRKVHYLVKKAYKATMFMSKVGMNIVAPGSTQAMSTALHVAKVGIKANVGVATHAAKTAVNAGVKTATKSIVNAVPTGIKTGVQSALAKQAAISGKLNAVHAGIHNRAFMLKKWLADSKLGKAMQAVARMNAQALQALRAALNFLKGIITKVVLIFAGLLLLVCLLSVIFTGITGAVGGGTILSPDSSDDGKIDLSKYTKILNEENKKFYQDIASLRTAEKYDNVYVNYNGATVNTREMLSMMAVRMSQELDMERNKEVEKYLKSLYADSHLLSSSVRNYNCAGCDTETYLEWGTHPETGLPIVEEKTRVICNGHKDLNIYISILGFDELFTADTYGNDGQTANAGEKIGDFKITYYCCEKYPHICNAGPPYQTATGTTPTPNRTIAVDPSVIPLGSHVIIDGKEYVAEDTGGAINGNRIDIVVRTHSEALNKGTRQNVAVYWPSYEGGDYQVTGEWDGWTEENIEWCKIIYNMDWNDLYTGYHLTGGSIGGTGGGGDGGAAGGAGGGIFDYGNLPIEGDLMWPVDCYTITSYFGYRGDIGVEGASTYHKGVDIGCGMGTPVYSSAAGTVLAATWDPYGGGNYVKIDHGGGVITRYLHNSQLLVSAGDTVAQGQVIALSGNSGIGSGPHLDYRIEINGTYVDPLKVFPDLF